VLDFLTNYLMPLLLSAGVGIAIVLFVLGHFGFVRTRLAYVVAIACLFAGLALVMAGIFPLTGLQPADEAAYFYAFSGLLLVGFSVRLFWPAISRKTPKAEEAITGESYVRGVARNPKQQPSENRDP
jgi:hypothetical protein